MIPGPTRGSIPCTKSRARAVPSLSNRKVQELGELRSRSRALRPAPLRRGEAYSPDNRGRNDQNESRLSRLAVHGESMCVHRVEITTVAGGGARGPNPALSVSAPTHE